MDRPRFTQERNVETQHVVQTVSAQHEQLAPTLLPDQIHDLAGAHVGSNSG